MPQLTIEQRFDQAARHHQAGQLQAAESIYRNILTEKPNHPGALHWLGMIAAQCGDLAAADQLIAKSVELAPTATHLGNYGSLLTSLGRFSDAVKAFSVALSADPANTLLRQTFAHCRFHWAESERIAGRTDAALQQYRAAIALEPAFYEAMNNAANVLQERGEIAEAAAMHARAAALKPDDADVQFNLGNTLLNAGDPVAATAAFERAIRLSPNNGLAHNNLGNALWARGLIGDASRAYQRAATLFPDSADIKVNVAIALHREGNLGRAIELLREAIAINPNLPEAHLDLGNALKDAGQTKEAIAAYREGLHLKPVSENWSNLLFALHLDPSTTPQQLGAEHAEWNRACVLPLLNAAKKPQRNLNPDRPLRIGYVSADFRTHPVGRFMLPLLRNHDRKQFEIYCYSDVRLESAMTQMMKQCATVWRPTAGVRDEKLAALIEADQIDILVELAMHTEDNRMLMLARKPAPLQVTYLAYCSTTGSQAIDYRFTDPVLDPTDGDQPFYAEQSVQLRTFWCYEEILGAPAVGPVPATSTGLITFSCFNNCGKVSQLARDAWCEILRQVPNSRLILHTPQGSHRDIIRSGFVDRGIDASRIDFLNYVPLFEYLAAYNRVDIALDPFPYPGGTTTCDGLWMGVPLITLAGNTAISRGGASILSQIGLPKLIAPTIAQYIANAVTLASDIPRLQSLRAKLRERMRASPLMDQPAFARDVESKYRAMWRRHCTGDKPGDLSATSPSADDQLKRGAALYRTGDLHGAIESLTAATQQAPKVPDAFLLLGNALKHSGKIREAIAAYRQAVVIEPTSRNWSNLLYALHFDPDITPQQLAAEHSAWNSACVLPLLSKAAPPTCDWDPIRPLRIGYVSPDFREHSVGRFILPLLSNHDRSQFRIYCYSDVRHETNITQAFKEHADIWRNTAGMPDDQVAQLIADDQIDILVELAMHTEDNRMLVLARKPAPIQISYLAYCSTTGSSAIDYRFSDPFLDPSDASQPHYSEQTIRLQSYWCYADYYGDKPIAPLPADANGYITFGCLNNFGKASAPTRQVWGAILRQVPNSRLLLYCQPGTHREDLLADFAKWGVEPHRVEFVGYQNLHDYLATYSRIDIALDPFPYPGGTTSCDALWMGTPLITLAGQSSLSRGGASVLSQIGHPELIAASADQYVTIASKLAVDLPRLRELRANLRQRMAQSRLMDSSAFAQDVESIYRDLWNSHCAKHHFALGNARREQNDLPGAISEYRNAVAIRPTMAEAHSNLGAALRATGQPQLAAASFAEAVRCNPRYVDGLNNHAIALREAGHLDASIAACRQALAINPESVAAGVTLGNALMIAGDLDGAIARFRKVVAIDPNSQAFDNLLYAINFHPQYSAQRIAAELAQWETIVARPAMALGRTSHRNDRTPGRKLRVGFVSPDLRDHTIGRFILPLFVHHDPQQMEIAAYAEVVRPDWMTDALRRFSTIWRDTRGMRDDVLANQIEADQVDILIDLAMHSDGGRLITFTQRPAPVQATYLAYCGSTGLHAIDYRISDPYIDPPAGADESIYVEKTVRLETFWCYIPPPGLPAPGAPAHDAQVTFGCLNNFSKVNADVLRCWSQILVRVPGSRLLIHAYEGAHRRRVLQMFEQFSVEPERIEFVGQQKQNDYFASYAKIDIALDPFPFGGGTTTCDALWMGVPVITLIGRTACGRGGSSVLNQIDLPELIALHPGDYTDIAVDLASDSARRTLLRKNLRDRMSRSPLMDAPRFARSFEAVCRSMWVQYCRGN